MLRIVLVLNRLELAVVLPIEVLLPVGVAEVTLAEVSGSTGSDLGELGSELVGDHLEGVLHRLPRDLVAPGSNDEKGNHGIAPARVNGVLERVVGRRSIETNTHNRGAVLVEELVSVHDALAVAEHDVFGQQAAGVDVCVHGQGGVHGRVELGVAAEVAEVAGVADVHLVELLHEGREEVAELRGGEAGAGHGADGKGLVGDEEAVGCKSVCGVQALNG